MQISKSTIFSVVYNERQVGSGFAVKNKLLTTVKSFNVINSRLTTLTLAIKWVEVVFINMCTSTEDKGDSEKVDSTIY